MAPLGCGEFKQCVQQAAHQQQLLNIHLLGPSHPPAAASQSRVNSSSNAVQAAWRLVACSVLTAAAVLLAVGAACTVHAEMGLFQ